MNIETTLNLLKVCPMNLWAKVRTGKHRRNRDFIANMLQLWQLWCQQQGKNYDDNNNNITTTTQQRQQRHRDQSAPPRCTVALSFEPLQHCWSAKLYAILINIYIHTYTYTYTIIYTYIYIYIYCIYCIYTYTHTYIYTIYTHIHIYIYTSNIYICIYTCHIGYIIPTLNPIVHKARYWMAKNCGSCVSARRSKRLTAIPLALQRLQED